MVLQRNVENPIWGWASPGDTVTVRARGQQRSATADQQGNWQVKLPPMKLGEPFSIVATGPKNEIRIDNVVVGEVWICSGQSNMEWTVNRSGNPEIERKNGDYPMIRHMKVVRSLSMAPKKECQTTGWKVCTPETVGEFSAVGYYFARKLHRELKVPIGLVNTTWGGTIVEAWTSGESLKSHPDFMDRIPRLENQAKDLESASLEFEAEIKAWQTKHDEALAKSVAEAAGDIDDSQWKTIQAPGHWENQGYQGFDGVAWYRKTIQLPQPMVGKPLKLSLGMIDDNDRTFVNGVKVGQTNGWQTERNYDIKPEINRRSTMTISVQVHDTSGAGGMHGNAKQLKLSTGDNSNSVVLSGPWRFQKSQAMFDLPTRPKRPGFNGPNNPTALYNAMIHPILPIAFRGAIWYQGESNAGRAHQYRTLFPLLINDWRKQWSREFPFYWVQLANFMKATNEPEPSAWAELREAQSMTLSLPRTGEAVIIDIGEARDIHPKNKQDVGKRLALMALKNDYGFDLICSGPRYKNMSIEGNKIRLSFEYAHGLRSANGKPLTRFEIADERQNFVWAEARFDGQDILVFADSIENPVAVRYAWANNPVGCNLTNESGLPASPFRTDDWAGITVGKK